ncbi:MAG: glycoside hydrolase family 5 protein [Elusimicrobia bacterium]|nr:glycoside hydrolase family 5 protein [Candidatus Liberimonas magnetica]
MRIKGVNIGGWLLMEGYILGGRNIPESRFKRDFIKVNGENELFKFEKTFRDNYINEIDFENISRMGANTVRVPFNSRLVEKGPYLYSKEGTEYIKKALDWAEKCGLKIILDLHAAIGAQNHDWHGDSDGRALLWDVKSYRERTCVLWEFIAGSFKNHPALLGYDVLNEPVVDKSKIGALKNFYRDVIKRIRSVDSKHTIFLEGNIWAQQIDFLNDLIDDNISISIHTYCPLTYTFNFSPFLKFPGKIEGCTWDSKTIKKYLKPYYDYSKKNKVEIYVGEFGINWRSGYYGELDWLNSILKAFDEYGFGYTYWTYKAMANSVFPDGLFQHISDNKYVNRMGPVFGWENYPKFWKTEKKQLADFWRTKNFTPNAGIIKALSKHF